MIYKSTKIAAVGYCGDLKSPLWVPVGILNPCYMLQPTAGNPRKIQNCNIEITKRATILKSF
jgi:hypothetical protein